MLSMDDLRYTADLPYPPIKVEMKNPAYAKAMLDNIGGLNSEMSAISLYVYNNLILEEKKEIAAIFHKVSIVEMHHLEIFGKLALQLGEDPRMWTHYGCTMPSTAKRPPSVNTSIRLPTYGTRISRKSCAASYWMNGSM